MPLRSFSDIEKIDPPCKFDLIFAGSVVTHLPEQSTRALLEKFLSWLNTGGLAVLSTHGSTAANQQLSGQFDYTLGGDRSLALTGYYRTGYGYADYPNTSGYGVSLTQPMWFLSLLDGLPAVEISAIIERGWDFHHDLIAFKRR